MRVQILYNRLKYQTHQLIDATIGGLLSNKYPNEAEQLFKDVARNESHQTTKAKAIRVAGSHEVDATTALEAKVNALRWKFNLLMLEIFTYVRQSIQQVMLCETYEGEHNIAQYPIVQVDYAVVGHTPKAIHIV